jgi:hypothetical protein
MAKFISKLIEFFKQFAPVTSALRPQYLTRAVEKFDVVKSLGKRNRFEP